jgi:hypothetical protein
LGGGEMVSRRVGVEVGLLQLGADLTEDREREGDVIRLAALDQRAGVADLESAVSAGGRAAASGRPRRT